MQLKDIQLKVREGWQIFLTKGLGLVIVKRPPESTGDPKDFVMALHWCLRCQSLRYDRHYDFVSRSERVVCDSCRMTRYTKAVFSLSFFFLSERYAIAQESHPRSRMLRVSKWWALAIFGIPNRLLPEDRGGRTTGELEMEAIVRMMEPLLCIVKMGRPL